MQKNDDKSDKLILIIGDTIRIKKNNFIKKWFSRTYRTDKSMKEFSKAGYPVGEYELSVDEFTSLVKENLTSHRKSVVKKAKDAFSPDSESIEIGRNTKRDRKAIKRKLSKKVDLTDKKLKKEEGSNKILFIVKEKKEEVSQELLEDEDW